LSASLWATAHEPDTFTVLSSFPVHMYDATNHKHIHLHRRRIEGLSHLTISPANGFVELLEIMLGWAGLGNKRDERYPEQTSSRVHYLVQLKAPITEASKAAFMRGEPLTLGPYVPHNAFLVTAAADAESRLRKLPGVVHVSQLLPTDKIPMGIRPRAGDDGMHPFTPVHILIHLADGHHSDLVAVRTALGQWERQLRTLGVANATFSAHSSTYIVGTVPIEASALSIEFLINRNEVQSPPPYATPRITTHLLFPNFFLPPSPQSSPAFAHASSNMRVWTDQARTGYAIFFR
jgi:hypothetical protein